MCLEINYQGSIINKEFWIRLAPCSSHMQEFSCFVRMTRQSLAVPATSSSWLIGVFIGIQTFSVPTSSCKALSLDWARSDLLCLYSNVVPSTCSSPSETPSHGGSSTTEKGFPAHPSGSVRHFWSPWLCPLCWCLIWKEGHAIHLQTPTGDPPQETTAKLSIMCLETRDSSAVLDHTPLTKTPSELILMSLDELVVDLGIQN
jgi:hypothetical protein